MIEKIRKIWITYGAFGMCELLYFFLRTKFYFTNARLIRFPFQIRGKKHVRVGKNFTTGFNCRIDAYNLFDDKIIIQIGNNVQINDNVHIGGVKNIEIQDNVLIASKVFISDHNHGSYSGEEHDNPNIPPSERLIHAKPVRIEENVWIGEFVSVLPGSIIGKGSIIGAMSLVNGNIPPYSIAVGSPARVIKYFDFKKNTWEKIKS